MSEERVAKGPAWRALPFSELWERLPELAGAVSPAVFVERMAVYRSLIEGAEGPPPEQRIFWGYASQLFWQASTGRLGEAVLEEGGRIADESWWGRMNLGLSVLPLRAAVDAGALPALEIDEAETARPEYGPARELWRRFFEAEMKRGPGDDGEPARFLSWRAHLATIEVGLERNAAAFAAMPGPERVFAKGWTRMVDFLGAAAASTDLNTLLEWGTGSLPTRMLTLDDAGLALHDMEPDTRRTVRRAYDLGRMPGWRFKGARWFWTRAMRRRDMRDKAGSILFGDGGDDPEVRRELRGAALRLF